MLVNNLDIRYCAAIFKQALNITGYLKLYLSLPKIILEVNKNVFVGWKPSFHIRLNDI